MLPVPKPMRLPNRFGTISKLSGNRRNPFRARVFEGYTNDGKQIYKNIGYYEKYQDALTALVEYHKNPLDFQADITFEELYEKWLNIFKIKIEETYPGVFTKFKIPVKPDKARSFIIILREFSLFEKDFSCCNLTVEIALKFGLLYRTLLSKL